MPNLLKSNQVRYLSPSVQTPKAVAVPPALKNSEIIEVDHFCVSVIRKNGTILGIRITHKGGDALELDFSYLQN